MVCMPNTPRPKSPANGGTNDTGRNLIEST